MKSLLALIILLLPTTLYAAEAPTFKEVVAKYSEGCQPLATEYLTRVQVAITLFNSNEYHDADILIQMMHESTTAILESESCNLEDSVLTLALSRDLTPLENNVACMLRVDESRELFTASMAFVEMGNIADAKQSLKDSLWTLQDIEDNNICQSMPEDLIQHLFGLKEKFTKILSSMDFE